MPFPIVQQPTETLSTSKKGFRVFVSYSHKDKNYSELFIKFFHNQLEATPQLGIKKEHVYYDRTQLLAGDDWDESIQKALDEAEYFIFLISINSLSSNYCLSRELATAAKRGLPILQILLSPCPWEKRKIPGDYRGRTLDALGALPKDDQFSLRPISAWPQNKRLDAWNRVVNDLAERIRRDGAQPATSELRIQSINSGNFQLEITPLLPYLCNQIPIVNCFNNRIRFWNSNAESKALMVLIRGSLDDNVPRFWSRLRCKNLKAWLTVRNEQLLEHRPLVWPIATNRLNKIEERTSDIMGALSESLTGNPFRLNNPVLLGQWLDQLSGVVPLVTTLPRESKKNLAASLQLLLDLLDQCPAGTRLDRLVISVLIEDDALLGERDLHKALKLKNHQRTHIIDLMPLQEMDEQDIRRWYRENDVDKICPLTENQLIKEVFEEKFPFRLRMGPFDTRVRPILGL